MSQLLDLSPEILHNIFYHVHPTDLSRLSRSCRHLHQFIDNDDFLWRLQFLSRFDPVNNPSASTSSWKEKLAILTNVEKILASENEQVKDANADEVLSRCIELATSSPSSSNKNLRFLNRLFRNPLNTSNFLCRANIFTTAKPSLWRWEGTPKLRQLSAHLHVLFGIDLESSWPHRDELCPHFPIDENAPDAILYPLRFVHPYARSRVYDLRRYTHANMWGPFLDDGSQAVDWEKVQAIMIVLAYNLRIYTERRLPLESDPEDDEEEDEDDAEAEASPSHAPNLTSPSSSSSSSSSPTSTSPNSQGTASSTSSSSTSSRTRPRAWSPYSAQLWESPFHGIAENSFKSQPLGPLENVTPPRHPELDALDPYGVTGTWTRVVCFLDYNDLYTFNFENEDIPLAQEREPISTKEAFRLIRLQLRVTKIEEPGENDGKDYPVVHFEGTSKSSFMAWDPNANSRIRGTVRQTPGGAIRWTTFSIFHGEERWRSEGVQVGGPRSARGVLGNWFDKDYDVHGPAGPTAFWKVSDDIVEDKPITTIGFDHHWADEIVHVIFST